MCLVRKTVIQNMWQTKHKLQSQRLGSRREFSRDTEVCRFPQDNSFGISGFSFPNIASVVAVYWFVFFLVQTLPL